ncbi:MAG TPA: hypothetical protein VMT03_20985 [Polyangia bacterium]|nr:hypothetical protein [Polyangia bacterium]
MTNSVLVRFSVVALALVGAACSNGQSFTQTDGGTGGGGHAGATAGTAGKGGTGGLAGHAGSGGAGGGTGGIVATGGTGGTAGSSGSGGTGGVAATGGAGGVAATGGTGGVAATGGTGGVVATGGTGGAAVVCDPATQHACAGVCVSNSSIATCGSRCDACTPPAGGTATCDGTSCGFTCGGSTPKQCLAAGICVASSGCCSNTDCPTNAGGQTGTCDTGTHTCNYACSGSTKSCTTGSTTVCIPTTGCCTNTDCTGTCMTCDATSHTCVAAKSMDDPNGRCAGTCDSTGACKSKQGQTCNTVAAGCISGTTCSPDGYCCDSACTGSCVACDLVGHQGTCTNLAANTAPHTNHSPCTGSGSTCGGSCNGSGACSYPTGSCGSPMCSGTGIVQAGTCSQGTCNMPAVQACAGDLVCSANVCKTSCTADADCLSTDFCADGTCHLRAVQIACGGRTTCALLTDNSIWCAGLNADGELGNGTISMDSPYGINTAVKTVGLPANDAPQQVVTGQWHTCTRLASGAVYCWGSGAFGEMGNGSFNGSTSPVHVPLRAAAKTIASGDEFICAVLTDNSVWCWGNDYDGQLGDGTYTNGRSDQGKASPVQVVTTLFNSPSALVASSGTAHVMSGSGIFSWGQDQYGELGTGTATTASPFGSATPVSTPYAGIAVAISAASSGHHACLLTNGAIIRCWGENDYGELGDGTVTPNSPYGEASANTVTGLTGTPSAVFAGGSHTCALMANGDFDCWGDDYYGEVGDGMFRTTGTTTVPSPTKATVVPSAPASAALGGNHTCVLLKNGSVWCWGYNINGQLGNGTFVDSPTAVRMTGW